MKKKLLTLNDLFSFYESHFSSDVTFDAKDNDGKPLVVQAYDLGQFEDDLKIENGLMFTRFKVCHTNINRNNSRISEENMIKAMPSLKYRPVMAYIKENSKGELDFDSHNMTVNDDDSITYEESQVGSFTENEPFLEYDEEHDKTYVIAYAAIPVDYTKTSEILTRKNGTKVSCELCINQMSYDAKEKVLDLTDFYFNAVTLLGDHIVEGMEGSRADLVDLGDFSAKDNTVTVKLDDEVIKLMQQQIDEHLSKLNIDKIYKEGGNDKVKLNELLEKYNKTVEDLDFDYEAMTDEELATKFEELFGETDEFKKKKRCSVEVNGKEYTFEISMEDKIRALESLVNDSYSEQDNAYYSVKTYENYVVMIDYWTGRAFKQNYKVDGDNYSLADERVEVYCTYLTKEEEAAIDALRADYEAVSGKLKEYEDKENASKKENILNTEDYDCIRETEEFSTLVKDAEKYSVEDIQNQCDKLLLDYVKTNKTFSLDIHKKYVRTNAPKPNEYKPYGDLF